MIISYPNLAKQRIAICESCKHFRKKSRTCGTPIIGNKVGSKRTCGCFMDAKTKLSFSKCPLGKWGELELKHEDYLKMKKIVEEVTHVIDINQKKALFELQRKYFGGNTKSTNCAPCIKTALNQIKRAVEEYEK